MASPVAPHPSTEARSNWLHMGTLIFLRWTAIIGQLAAITIANRFFDIQLPLVLCYATVAASVAVNLVLTFSFPRTKRLTERGGFLSLLFDLTQLCVLLAFSGGSSGEIFRQPTLLKFLSKFLCSPVPPLSKGGGPCVSMVEGFTVHKA